MCSLWDACLIRGRFKSIIIHKVMMWQWMGQTQDRGGVLMSFTTRFLCEPLCLCVCVCGTADSVHKVCEEIKWVYMWLCACLPLWMTEQSAVASTGEIYTLLLTCNLPTRSSPLSSHPHLTLPRLTLPPLPPSSPLRNQSRKTGILLMASSWACGL